jgi:F5/8 type C domain/Glycosyltransferase family 87
MAPRRVRLVYGGDVAAPVRGSYRQETAPQRRRWAPTILVAATALALAAKLYISFRFIGTVDIAYWKQFAIRSHLGVVLYDASEIFNHPPWMLHMLPAIAAFAERSGLSFAFCFRLLPIFADVGSVWLVWRLTQRRMPALASPAAVVLMAIAPTSVLISGYHGNTDPLMIFFVLLAVYLRETSAAWAAGIAFGMAMNIKVVPLIFAPAMLLYRYELRRAAVFAAAAAATVIAASMPFLAQDPWLIARRVFGYASPGDAWGIPLLLHTNEEALRFPALYAETWSALPGMLDLYALAVTAAKAYAAWGKFVIMAVIALIAHGVNRLRNPPPLFIQCGVSAAAFLFCSPGFGLQYLAWLVPWAVAAGALPAALFYAVSGAFLYVMYAHNLQWTGMAMAWSLATWLTVGTVLLMLSRRIAAALAAERPTRSRAEWRMTPPLAAAAAGLVVILIALIHANARALSSTPGFYDQTFVTASSTYNGDYPPEGALDGRTAVTAWGIRGGWNSAGTPRDDTPEFLTVLFAAPRTVRHITLHAYPDPHFTLRSFVFQYRAERQWHDIEATRVRDNFEATRWDFDVPAVTSRQIRLLISRAADDEYARVLEVEFAGDGAPIVAATPP